MSDKDIQKLENQFPALSGQAFAAARQQTLDAGLSVLQSRHGVIYEVFPNGERTVVKHIAMPISVVPGSRFTLQ